MSNVTLLKSRDIRLSNCIVSFPKLIVPEATKKNGQVIGSPRYTAKFILPVLTPEEYGLLVGRVQDAVKSAHPTTLPPGWSLDPATGLLVGAHPNNNCFKAPEAQFAGRIVVGGSSAEKKPPTVVDQQRARMDATRMSELFSGCVVTVAGHFYCYDQGTPGLTFQMDIVQLKDNLNVTRLDNSLGVDEALDGDEGPVASAPTAPVQNYAAAPQGTAALPPSGYVPAPAGDVPDFMR